VPPTGRQVTIIGNDFSRVVDDKIAEHWAQFDGLGTMMQLGAIAAPEPEDVSAHMRLS
jgi:predicted ester cyclase